MQLRQSKWVEPRIEQRFSEIILDLSSQARAEVVLALRVAETGIMNLYLERLNKHRPVPRISIKFRRLSFRWPR